MVHLSAVFVIGKGRFNMKWVFGVIFPLNKRNVCKNNSNSPNTAKKQDPRSVIGRSSIMIHLSGVFVIEKGKYAPICA
jgi:hypothetical protein